MAMCMYEHVEVEEWKFDPPFFPSTVYLVERRPRIPATADLDTNRKFMLAFPAFTSQATQWGTPAGLSF